MNRVLRIRDLNLCWGLFQLSGALHDVSPGYWNSANTIGTALVGGNALLGVQNFGHPDSKLGGAVNAALHKAFYDALLGTLGVAPAMVDRPS
jgi:hypothetical protein